ncbi:MAG: ATP-binding cassette domain-containing protein [Thermoplasmataceae archaeon]
MNLELNKGDVLGIAGANGSGKTTLVETIAGIRRLDSGEIYYRGTKLRKEWRILKSNMLIVSLDIPFFNNLSVFENIELVSNFLPHKSSEQEILEKLKLVGLSGSGKTLYKDLSRGMKQRLAFAEYFLRQPELVVMDEPTEGLDPASKSDITEILKSIKEGKGLSESAIIISHDLDLLSTVCTNILMLSKGRIVENGSYKEIIERFQEKFVIVNSDPQTISKHISDFSKVSCIPIGLNSSMIPSDYAGRLISEGFEMRKPEPHDIFRRDDYV